jgi:hypothetical protein
MVNTSELRLLLVPLLLLLPPLLLLLLLPAAPTDLLSLTRCTRMVPSKGRRS